MEINDWDDQGSTPYTPPAPPPPVYEPPPPPPVVEAPPVIVDIPSQPPEQPPYVPPPEPYQPPVYTPPEPPPQPDPVYYDPTPVYTPPPPAYTPPPTYNPPSNDTTTVITPPPPPPAINGTAYIDALYRGFFGREADAGGEAVQVAAYNAFAQQYGVDKANAEFASRFLNADEAKANAAKVVTTVTQTIAAAKEVLQQSSAAEAAQNLNVQLAQAAKQVADEARAQAGLAAYGVAVPQNNAVGVNAKVQTGADLFVSAVSAQAGGAAAPPAQSGAGAYIAQLYTNILGRQADAAGLAFQTNAFEEFANQHGVDAAKAEFTSRFQQSTENKPVAQSAPAQKALVNSAATGNQTGPTYQDFVDFGVWKTAQLGNRDAFDSFSNGHSPTGGGGMDSVITGSSGGGFDSEWGAGSTFSPGAGQGADANYATEKSDASGGDGGTDYGYDSGGTSTTGGRTITTRYVPTAVDTVTPIEDTTSSLGILQSLISLIPAVDLSQGTSDKPVEIFVYADRNPNPKPSTVTLGVVANGNAFAFLQGSVEAGNSFGPDGIFRYSNVAGGGGSPPQNPTNPSAKFSANVGIDITFYKNVNSTPADLSGPYQQNGLTIAWPGFPISFTYTSIVAPNGVTGNSYQLLFGANTPGINSGGGTTTIGGKVDPYTIDP
ncbi:hypothetical protein [Roseiterribacter gracilis]|uniref:Uncharacterized protein n=1 Tax=Roseiterribacter gracilis TaxID=2812848 RepID=A0A8S8XDA7_9PROT|nr:hypothetical protein TMPK1_36600 [Rhodospirillales bacterium TMPK1]